MLSKREQKYRAKQQLANKFQQKMPNKIFFEFDTWELVDKKAIEKLADKICK